MNMTELLSLILSPVTLSIKFIVSSALVLQFCYFVLDFKDVMNSTNLL